MRNSRKSTAFTALATVIVLAVSVFAGPTSLAEDNVLDSPSRALQLQIDKAKTRVGFANVTLYIRNLTVMADKILGDYELKIPLAPMMNDRGTLEILLPEPLDGVIEAGKALLGRGDSTEDGRRHGILCSLLDDGNVQIRVDTGDRILDFRTRYSLQH